MYKPLEMVYLVQYQDEVKTTQIVPAIFVKALAEQKEWIEVDREIRIGFDILALIAGIVALGTTANPGLLALAVADIALATGDIAIQSIVGELQKTKEGHEFLKTWENIYMVGGIATAIISAPQLVQSFYKLGNSVIKNASKLNNSVLLKGIREFYLKAYIDINSVNFVGNTVKALEEVNEIVLATGGVLNDVKVDQLLRKDVITVIEQIQNGDKLEEYIALIYKGEAIIKASKKDFFKASFELLKKLPLEKKFIEACEEIYKVVSFVSKYERKLRTKLNEAFFWSGRTDGIGGQKIALEIALSKKGITLEGLIDKNKIPMPVWNPDNDNIQAIWASISKKYADQVSGEIRAVVGKSLRENNIWETFELPALKNNPNVKKIIIIDPKTKKEAIIFKR